MQGSQKGEAARPTTVLSSATLTLGVRPLAAAARAPLTDNNQKLGLLAALLRVRAALESTAAQVHEPTAPVLRPDADDLGS